jgi:biopolymer transport protein ExbD
MKIPRKNKKNISIADSGALSDLAFLLIVFFIVIAVFTVNQGFMLGLPQKSSTKIVHVDDIIKIMINEDNQLLHDDKNVTLEDVENLLSKKLSEKPDMTFLLKIHPDARYQNVIDIMNIVEKLDIKTFSFSMIKEESL